MLAAESRHRGVLRRLAELQGLSALTIFSAREEVDDRPARSWLLLQLLLVAACFGSLLLALTPAVDGDALCYHLALPKQYLQSGGFVPLPYHDNSTFPLLVEMLFLWALALDSAEAAQLVHWLFGLLLAAATFELARDVVGRRWAAIAAAIAVLTPAVTNQMGAAFNDLALAVFTTFALVAWRRAENCPPYDLPAMPSCSTLRGDREGSQSSIGPVSSTNFVPAGIMFGAALGTKYVAFLFVAAFGLTLFARVAVRRKLSVIRWNGVLVATVVAASVAGPWYLRAAIERGNPIYPFMGSVFSTAGPETDRPSKRPLSASAADVVMAPWQVTMHPQRFGGRGNQLGVLFLAAVPGVVLIAGNRKLWLLLGMTACYLVFWYGLRQNVRFLLPVVPLLAVIVAAVWRECHHCGGLPAHAISFLCIAALAFNAAQAVHRAADSFPVVIGSESRVAYLRRSDPTFAVAEFVANRLPLGASILSQDYRLYYFPCLVTQEKVFRRQSRYHQNLASRPLAQQFREAGFTHLLLMEVAGSEVNHSAKLGKLLAQEGNRAGALGYATLMEHEHVLPNGERRRYRLVEVPGVSNRIQ